MKIFSSLSAREKILLGIASLVGVLMLFYFAAWEPTQMRLKSLREQQLPQSEQTLAWVRQALASAENQAGVKREEIIEGPLLTVIEQTAEKAQVRAAIQRMQPNQNQEVKIWMDEVEFDLWLGWLELLRQQNVVADRVSIGMISAGIVDIRMTVGR